MKTIIFFILILSSILLTCCVQKSSNKTVVVKLNVEGLKNIQTVGIRGNQQPLSWDYDMELKPIIKNKIYTTTFTQLTGYKFTEVKFTVNGQFELNDKANRKIVFSKNDTTFYEAKFDLEK